MQVRYYRFGVVPRMGELIPQMKGVVLVMLEKFHFEGGVSESLVCQRSWDISFRNISLNIVPSTVGSSNPIAPPDPAMTVTASAV